MKSINFLPLKNLVKKPFRSVALIMLAAFLAVSAFGGSVIVSSLRGGLDSLSARLGADVVVIPYEATQQYSAEDYSVILQGKPGQFYMDKKCYTEIQEKIDGIDKITAQFFLTTIKASCCSTRLQIIGFDPDTDFSVQQWVEKTYSKELGLYDAVVGSNVTPNADMTLKFFNKKLRVVSALDKTGTDLDSAVFVNTQTMKELIKARNEINSNHETKVNPDNVVSSVLIKVRDDVDIDDVVGNINLYIKGVTAMRTQNMISDVSDSLNGVSGVIGSLMTVVWMLSVVMMAVAFTMMMNERKKEFAVLRVLGASRAKLGGFVFKEAALLSLIGSAAGVVMVVIAVTMFGTAIEESIGLPFLLPGAGVIAMYAAATMLVTMIVGALAAAFSAVKISRLDTGLILRGDN